MEETIRSRLPKELEIATVQGVVLYLQIRNVPVDELRLQYFTDDEACWENPPFTLIPVHQKWTENYETNCPAEAIHWLFIRMVIKG